MNSDMTHVCKEGETFDSVSVKMYGDERYSCELLIANPALCHLAHFRGGEVLAVPAVDVPEADEAEESRAPVNAPWKE